MRNTILEHEIEIELKRYRCGDCDMPHALLEKCLRWMSADSPMVVKSNSEVPSVKWVVVMFAMGTYFGFLVAGAV